MALYKYKNGQLVKVAGNYGSKPDAELSETSENAVQNKVVTAEINGLKLTKLWENSNTTVDFNAQTITIPNLKDFNTICISYRDATFGGVNSSGYFFGRNEINNAIMFSFTIDVIHGRQATIKTETTIEISGSYNGTANIDNRWCIPVAIYGTNL